MIAMPQTCSELSRKTCPLDMSTLSGLACLFTFLDRNIITTRNGDVSSNDEALLDFSQKEHKEVTP